MLKVIFTDNNLPASIAIRLITWSQWSHVGIILPDNSVIDSRWSNGGVNRYTMEQFMKDGVKRHVIREFKDISDSAIDAIATQIGKPYDLTAILGIPFRRDWQEDDSWFCSELVAWGCEQAGTPLVNKERWRVTPQDIFEARG